MPKYRVDELEGALLDAAVAKAEGFGELDGIKIDSGNCWIAEKNEWDQYIQDVWYSPSTDWSDGGPIIERERLHLVAWPTGEWGASVDQRIGMTTNGKTPLIAAMRAYVASKFGQEVELP